MRSSALPATFDQVRGWCRVAEWRPWPFDTRGTLLGHATIAFAGGWTVHRIPVFRGDGGGLSAGVPKAAEIDADGRVRLRPDGKRAYNPVITFETRDARKRWQDSVVSALRAAGIGASS